MAVPFIKDKLYIPANKVDEKTLRQNYEVLQFNDKICSRCEYFHDRPCSVCAGGCEGFITKLKVWGEKNIKGKKYYYVPFGDVFKTRKVLGIDVRKVQDKREELKFDYPIKFTGELRTGKRVNGFATVNQKQVVEDYLKYKFGLIQCPARSGKCLVGSTMVNTSEGFLHLKELINKKGYNPYYTSVTTESGIEPVTYTYKEKANTIKIKTNYGNIIEGTPEHPVRVIDRDLNFIWKRLEDLQIDDYIVGLPLSTNSLFGNRNNISIKWAKLLGYLTANGRRTEISSGDTFVTNKLEKLLTKLKIHYWIEQQKDRVPVYHIKDIHDIIKNYGYLSGSCNKHIPLCIRQSSKEIIHAFLTSYFECDSGINGSSIELISASKTLVQEVANLLCCIYGINGRVYSVQKYLESKKLYRNYYVLNLIGYDGWKFCKEFPTSKVARKYSNRFNAFHTSQSCTIINTIPFVKEYIEKLSNKTTIINLYHKVGGIAGPISKKPFSKDGFLNCTQATKQKWLDWTNEVLKIWDDEAYNKVKKVLTYTSRYERIVKITKSKKKKWVYDITVPGSHSFIANGLISHNTVMATYIACKLGMKTIIIAKQEEFLKNFYKTFMSMTNVPKIEKKLGHPIVKVVKKVEDLKDCQVGLVLYQKFIRESGDERIRKYINGRFSTLIIDECFRGDTEILTENGWVKFKNLKKGVKVAQYNNDGSVSFVTPTRYIKKPYNKPLYKMKLPYSGFAYTTAKHNVVYMKNGKINKSKACDIKSNWGKVLIDRCNGVKGCTESSLTDYERLLIAIQADGNYQGWASTYLLSVHKKRKIKRFKKIIKNFDFINEISAKPGFKRWSIHLNNDLYRNKAAKYLSTTFKLSDFSFDKANDFINEVCLWDGYINKQTGLPQFYCSCIKENVDFVCAVAVLAGYHCNQKTWIDPRKDTYKRMYGVTFSKSKYKLSIPVKCKKDYNKNVYCVEVPSHMLVVRASGIPFISGNCHGAAAVAFAQFVNKLEMRFKLGLSATPLRKDGRDCLIREIIGPVVAKSASIGMVPLIDLVETGVETSKYQGSGPASWVYAMKWLYSSEERNKQIVRQVFRDINNGHNCVLIPTDHKKHMNLLVDMINKKAKRLAKLGKTLNGEKIDWRNFAVAFHAGSPRDQILADIDNGRYKCVVCVRSIVKEGIDIKQPSCIYIQTPMSASPQPVGSPFFYQLANRVCTPYAGKRQPVIRIFVDGLGQSLGCLRSLFFYEIMPGLKRGKNGENPRYMINALNFRRITDINLQARKRAYKPLNRKERFEKYSQYQTEFDKAKGIYYKSYKDLS